MMISTVRPPIACTLTGADDHTDISRLRELSAQFPFVEWGVLYFPTEQGMGRYPSAAWLANLHGKLMDEPGQRFSLHVCGRAVQSLLEGDRDMLALIEPFPRVQLNMHAQQDDVAALLQLMGHFPHKQFITQHNEQNNWLWEALRKRPNHQVLFDASGGRGLARSEWPQPLGHVAGGLPVCGYAGGLGPESMQRDLPLIAHAAGDRPYWVDMEGRIRDNDDRFHLGLVRLTLEIVRNLAFPPYGRQEAHAGGVALHHAPA